MDQTFENLIVFDYAEKSGLYFVAKRTKRNIWLGGLDDGDGGLTS